MFKKGLAILLGFVLLFTQVVSVCVIATNPEQTQWTQDFENYNPTNASISNNTITVVERPTSVPARSGSSGTKVAKGVLTAAGTQHLYLFPNDATKKLSANKTYTVSFWIYNVSKPSRIDIRTTISNTAYYSAGVVLSNVGGSALTTGQWAQKSVTVTPTSDTYIAFSLAAWTAAGHEFYLDDVVVTEVKKSTITFNTNGGSSVTAINGDAGSAISMPANPTKSGYTFAGWYTDSALTQKFTATTFPNADITLYAKWNAEGVLEQDFEDYNPTNAAISNNTITVVERPTSVPARSGSSGTKVAKGVLTAAGTQHLYLFPNDATKKLSANKTYTVSFWIYSVAKPSAIDVKTTVSNTAYDVNGVLLGRVGGSALTTGQWEQKSVTVTPTSDTYIAFSVAAWTAAGHEFYLDDVVVTEVKESTITFNTNGGSSVDAIKGGVGTTITLPSAPTKENYAFVGWYTDSALTQRFTATVYPQSNITLYAKWREAGVLKQDFEDYNPTNASISNNTIIVVERPSSVPVREGSSGSKVAKGILTATGTQHLYLFPSDSTAKMYADKAYNISFWIYSVAKPSAIDVKTTVSNAAYDANGTLLGRVAGSSLTTNQWEKKSVTISPTSDTFIAFSVGTWTAAGHEFYLDDIVITEVPLSTISFDSNGGSTVDAIKGGIGSKITLPATPTKDGKMFNGWYTDATLENVFDSTVFPSDSITLYAGWVDENDYNQDFEGYVVKDSLASGTLSIHTKQNDTDLFVHSGKKSLYKPGVNASYFLSVYPYANTSLIEGKGYKLKMWVYAPQEITKDYEGAIRLNYITNKSNGIETNTETQTNIKYFNSSFKAGEWQELELIFIARQTGYVGLYSYGAFEMYIDDISLVEVDIVTVSFDTCGGNAMESISGASGQVVSTVPTPTHPNDMAFAGWFKDKEYTEKFMFKNFPETDLKLYAKWIQKGSFEQTFENYYYEEGNWPSAYSKDVFSIYHATSKNDEYVHSGKASMRYYQKLNPDQKTYAFSIFDPTMGELELGEKYYVSYYMKFTEISNTVYHAVYNNSVVSNTFANYLMKGYTTVHKEIIGKKGDVSQYFFGPAGKIQVSEPDENGWIKFTFEAIANDKYFSIYMDWDAEVYIDDVTVVPIPSGVVNSDYDKPYCEPLYDEINYQQPKALNKKANTPQVYPLELTARGDYVFSAELSKNAKDGYVALAWDAEGKNIIEGTKVAAGKSIVARLILDKSDTVYLVVYNTVGKGAINRATICRTLSAKETVSKQEPTYEYVDESNLPELNELLKGEEFAEVFRDAMFETDFNKKPVLDSSDGGASSDTEADLPESEPVLPDEEIETEVEIEEEIIPEEEDVDTAPQTSDMIPIVSVIVISVIALGTIIVCSIKKRRGLDCNV